MTEPWPSAPTSPPRAPVPSAPAPAPGAPPAAPGAGPAVVHRTAAGGPFDPPGVVWQPVSPKLVAVREISLALGFGLPLAASVALAVLSGVAGLWSIPAVIAALWLWGAILVPRQVRALGYAERDDDLLFRKGIMFRTLVVVPYGRMQFVDVQAGPLDRWGGIAKVQLHTGSRASDAAIPGLSPAEADRLRDRLAERGEARLAGL